MEQTKALNALEPFLALTKSATTPRQAADLVVRATSAPQTYLFAELLSTPQIQALSSSPEYSSHLSLLQIFSHGTYASYTTTTGLPTLSPPQTLKLRQLSLLTLAKDRVLSYAGLTSSLGLGSHRELEETVTSAVYAGLVDATLDPVHENVNIHSVAPLRDVDAGTIPDLLSSLKTWAGRCEAALGDLESRVKTIREAADARTKREGEWAARVGKLVQDESESGAASEWRAGHQGSVGQGQGGQTLGGGLGGSGLPARTDKTGSRGWRGYANMKRGSGHMDSQLDEEDDEAMDLDEEEEVGGKGKNKSSRRKLLG